MDDCVLQTVLPTRALIIPKFVKTSYISYSAVKFKDEGTKGLQSEWRESVKVFITVIFSMSEGCLLNVKILYILHFWKGD